MLSCLFFLTAPSTTEIYTLSLHDALPISDRRCGRHRARRGPACGAERVRAAGDAAIRLGREPVRGGVRSEEHTSELQSRFDLVCRLLLEKKKEEVIIMIFDLISLLALDYC